MADARAVEEEITPKRMGFDPLRPLRYTAQFIGGTFSGTLDSMALWGRRGSLLGTVAGFATPFLVAGFAGATIPLMIAGFALGLAGGAAMGGVLGALTGGAQAVSHAANREQKADSMAKQQEPVKAKPVVRGPSPEQAMRARRRAEAINFARLQDHEQDLAREQQQRHVEQEMERRRHREAHRHHPAIW